MGIDLIMETGSLKWPLEEQQFLVPVNVLQRLQIYACQYLTWTFAHKLLSGLYTKCKTTLPMKIPVYRI